MSNQWKAHAALFSANLIYGANYSIAKALMPFYIKPFGFIVIRAASALALFFLTSVFIKDRKIDRADWPRIFACGVFGVAINQLLFFKGLSLTTPIHAAIMMVCTPIIVLLLSTLSNREKLSRFKLVGVAAGFAGALILIFSANSDMALSDGNMAGDMCVFFNALSWGGYLVLAKPLMQKYHTIHLVKWVFLFGFVCVLPFGWQEFNEINWLEMPQDILLRVLFVILGSTYLAYLLNTLALKWANPSLVSGYIYLQPVLATIFAMALGSDDLSFLKIVSACFIFSGVYLISKKPQLS